MVPCPWHRSASMGRGCAEATPWDAPAPVRVGMAPRVLCLPCHPNLNSKTAQKQAFSQHRFPMERHGKGRCRARKGQRAQPGKTTGASDVEEPGDRDVSSGRGDPEQCHRSHSIASTVPAPGSLCQSDRELSSDADWSLLGKLVPQPARDRAPQLGSRATAQHRSRTPHCVSRGPPHRGTTHVPGLRCRCHGHRTGSVWQRRRDGTAGDCPTARCPCKSYPYWGHRHPNISMYHLFPPKPCPARASHPGTAPERLRFGAGRESRGMLTIPPPQTPPGPREWVLAEPGACPSPAAGGIYRH